MRPQYVVWKPLGPCGPIHVFKEIFVGACGFFCCYLGIRILLLLSDLSMRPQYEVWKPLGPTWYGRRLGPSGPYDFLNNSFEGLVDSSAATLVFRFYAGRQI